MRRWVLVRRQAMNAYFAGGAVCVGACEQVRGLEIDKSSAGDVRGLAMRLMAQAGYGSAGRCEGVYCRFAHDGRSYKIFRILR